MMRGRLLVAFEGAHPGNTMTASASSFTQPPQQQESTTSSSSSSHNKKNITPIINHDYTLSLHQNLYQRQLEGDVAMESASGSSTTTAAAAGPTTASSSSGVKSESSPKPPQPSSSVDSIHKAYLKQSLQSYDGIIEQLDILSTSLKLCGLSSGQINEILVNTLCGLVKRFYDSDRLQRQLFCYFHDERPKFFTELLQVERFRRLIYQLSEKYANCEFLSCMIRYIAEKEEFREELKGVASAATTQYDVFQKALKDSLVKLAHLPATDNYSERHVLEGDMMRDFCNLCSHEESTYIYSQCVLNTLAHECQEFNADAAGHFRRISEELERHVIGLGKTPETLMRKILMLIRVHQLMESKGMIKEETTSRDITEAESKTPTANTPTKTGKPNPYSEITTSIITMLSQHQTFASDIVKLHKQYSVDNVPPIEFLRNADLITLMLRDLYDPRSKKTRSEKTKYIYLLTLAAVGDAQNKEAISSLRKAFVETIKVCSDKSSARNLIASLRVLRKFTQHNIICKGIFIWIQNVFDDPESFGTSEASNIRIYLAFTEEIAYKHKSLRPSLLSLAKSLLKRKHGVDAQQAVELQRILVHLFTFSIRLGLVLETLQSIRDIAAHVDLALLRHIVQQILGLVAPPYSAAFQFEFCDLLCFSRFQDAFMNQQKNMSSVTSFVRDALNTAEVRRRFSREMIQKLEAF